MMNAELFDGFAIISLVTLMCLVISPVLVWVLPDRRHPTNTKTTA
jgi:hypothetical protein